MRQICYDLTDWVSKHGGTERPKGFPNCKQEDLPFRVRSTSITPIEGHWKGSGDILWRPDIRFYFRVEAKCVEGWSFDQCLNENWPIGKWWGQAQEQAREAGVRPLLIFTRNRQPTWAATRWRDTPQGVFTHCVRAGDLAIWPWVARDALDPF